MINFLASQAGGISFTVIFAVLTVVVLVAAIWLFSIGFKGQELKLKLSAKQVFIIVLVVGAIIRMVVDFSMKGIVGYTAAFSVNRAGYNGLFNMTNFLVNKGFNGFLGEYSDVFLYPIPMYLLMLFGSLLSLFVNLSVNSQITLVFLKLPFIIAEILLAVFAYKIAKKYANETVAIAVGGLIALCPVFMLGSLAPSGYVFFALALVVMVYFMLERRYVLMTVAYSLSLLCAFETIFLLPVVAVFLIYAYVKKVIAYRNSGEKGNVWNSQFGLIVKLPVAILACMLISYLVTLPFTNSFVGANPFKMLYVYFIEPFGNLRYFTYNGLSLYSLFNRNAARLDLTFPVYVFSILFMVAIVAITLIIYLSKKNRANLMLFVSYVLLTINTYFVDSTELTLLPFMALLLIAIVVLKDKRLVKIFGIMSLMIFLNFSGVMLQADYFRANATFATEILSDGFKVLGIICSAITVLTHIYFTSALLDIVLNGKIKTFEAADNKLSSAIKDFVKIKDNE
ncbi:MAG: hypothetical protein IKC35_03795 [Clostridia bacterium]|nr:hypothetical protein [Clostridia bacterium]